jgi:hypothetical protein
MKNYLLCMIIQKFIQQIGAADIQYNLVSQNYNNTSITFDSSLHLSYLHNERKKTNSPNNQFISGVKILVQSNQKNLIFRTWKNILLISQYKIEEKEKNISCSQASKNIYLILIK